MKHIADQTFLSFEQSIRDREQAERDSQIAAKAAAKAAREEAKRKEQMEKNSRRWAGSRLQATSYHPMGRLRNSLLQPRRL